MALDSNLDYSIFYMGVLVENIVFSLGLGQKQKHILEAKKRISKKIN